MSSEQEMELSWTVQCIGKHLCGDDSELFDLNPWNEPSKVGTYGFTSTLFSWLEAIYPAMIVGVVLYVLLSILME